mmetsp:Transcript_2764/g.8307  ORF Transcript_2764/g.8307 Transcript_2764/m.8307 type:complete len:214 (-) Transcript_2764:437-1078(-)
MEYLASCTQKPVVGVRLGGFTRLREKHRNRLVRRWKDTGLRRAAVGLHTIGGRKSPKTAARHGRGRLLRRKPGGRKLQGCLQARMVARATITGAPVLPAPETTADGHCLVVVLGDLEDHAALHAPSPNIPPTADELQVKILPADRNGSRLHRKFEVVEDEIADVVSRAEHAHDRTTRRSLARDLLVGDGEKTSRVVRNLMECRHVAIKRCPTA